MDPVPSGQCKSNSLQSKEAMTWYERFSSPQKEEHGKKTVTPYVIQRCCECHGVSHKDKTSGDTVCTECGLCERLLIQDGVDYSDVDWSRTSITTKSRAAVALHVRLDEKVQYRRDVGSGAHSRVQSRQFLQQKLSSSRHKEMHVVIIRSTQLNLLYIFCMRYCTLEPLPSQLNSCLISKAFCVRGYARSILHEQ